MEKKAIIRLPKGKQANNIQARYVDGEIQVSYDVKDKFFPKDGDFLTREKDSIVVIYKDTDYSGGVVSYAGGCCKTKGHISTRTDTGWGYTEDYRPATVQEKKSFLERLKNECDKIWNAEKKCLEDVYVPKFGDIVKVIDKIKYKRDYMICIYPQRDEPYNSHYIPGFFNIANLDLAGNLSFYCGNKNDGDLHIVPASETEKQELFEKLAKVGKRWNQETKQIEDIRWRAEKMKEYYCIEEYNNEVLLVYDLYVRTDNKRYEAGNYFRTREAAQKVADQIKEIFKNSKPE